MKGNDAQQDLFRPSPPAPPPPRGAYVLRDYQVAADAAIDKALEKNRSALIVLATGTGKTLVYAEQARKRGSCLVLAPQNELIKQAAQKIRHHTGEDVAIEKAEREAYKTPFVVASVQSLYEERLARFAKLHDFDLIICDEAHKSVAKSWRRVLDAFPRAKVLGGTATPKRADGVGMWNVFDKFKGTKHGAAYVYRIRDGLDEAWLTSFDYRPVFAPIDLNAMRAMKTGDIDPKAMDLEIAKQAGEIAKALIDSCHGSTLGFTTGVASAEVTAEALNRLRPGCARSIHGLMDERERGQIIKAHQRGEFDYLMNCAVLIEGYDDPRLMNVFDAALTKSVMRHTQKLGRGTRLWPEGIDHLETKEERHAAIKASPKPRWNYFHLNGIGDRHDIATPVDILGGTATQEERRVAKGILRENGGSVEAALTEARQRVAEEKARLAAIAAREAEARRTKIGDHRDPFRLLHLKPQQEWEGVFEPCSDAQRRRLRELGVRPPEKLSKMQAGRMIGTCIKRNKLGLATADQLRRMSELGIDGGIRMKAKTAADILNAHYERQRAKRMPWMTSWGDRQAVVTEREPGQEG
jgi:superfamily II DNA or RNA helicase